MARHDRRLGLRIWRDFIEGRETVKLKTLVYALRPAAALRWLRAHPQAAVAPMALPVLLAQSDPPAEVAGLVEALIARKAAAREMDSGPAPAPLLAFIRAELEGASGWAGEAQGEAGREAGVARAQAARLHRGTVERLDAG